jgi:hypothetical protein
MLSLRARSVARPLCSRFLSSTTRLRADADARKPPQAPKPIDDSTSALDYKRSHRTRPPPLPTMDLPRSRSAEEAVTNILYNTPPPSLQPFKKSVPHTFFPKPLLSLLDMSSIVWYKMSREFSPVFLESWLGEGSISIPWSCVRRRFAT